MREIVEARGLTAYALGRLADVDPGVVSRFLTGTRDIRLETADRLATALGLRLVELGRIRGRTRPVPPRLATPEPEPASAGRDEMPPENPSSATTDGRSAVPLILTDRD